MSPNNTPIATHTTGVPADHIDPNHPHFPTDSEAQLLPRPSYRLNPCLNKKSLWITFLAFLVTGSLIGAIFAGIKVGTDRAIAGHNKANGTVYVTTTVVQTTMVDVSVTPKPTTVTQILSTIRDDSSGKPTATATLPFSAPLRPTLIPTTPASSKCTFSDKTWQKKEECDTSCQPEDGKQKVCGQDEKGWTCVTCPLSCTLSGMNWRKKDDCETYCVPEEGKRKTCGLYPMGWQCVTCALEP